jgi:hypothetical protein
MAGSALDHDVEPMGALASRQHQAIRKIGSMLPPAGHGTGRHADTSQIESDYQFFTDEARSIHLPNMAFRRLPASKKFQL